jgi:hypothetical protein
MGLRGRLSEKVVVGLVGGYGQMDYDESSVGGGSEDASYAQDLTGFPEGVIGVFEIGWEPSTRHSLTMGYRKAFQDVYFTNYVGFHNAFIRYEGTFADRVGLSLNSGYRFENYVGEISREDHLLNAGIDVAYKATPFLDVGLGGGWTQRASADGNNAEIEYDDTVIRAGLTLTY